MDRRPLGLIGIVAIIGVVLAVAGVLALRGGGSGSGASPGAGASSAGGASPTPNGSPLAVATSTASSAAATASAAASNGPAATCAEVTQLVAVRAVAPDTGFPVKVVWNGLGPADDLHFTLSDVAPTIPLDPAGPASLTIGLSYLTGGDRFAFTAGSVALAYDAASGRLTGDVATGYGKNSNRATTDAAPSKFEGTLRPLPSPGTDGVLTGSIAHPARTFAFTVPMTTKTIRVASGPGCPSVRPTDAP